MLCADLAGVGGYLDPSAACSRAGVREGGKATAMLSSLTNERRCFSCWIMALRTGKVIAAPCAGHGQCSSCPTQDFMGWFRLWLQGHNWLSCPRSAEPH